MLLRLILSCSPSPTSDASALSVVNVDPTLKSGSGNYSSSFILWEPDLGLVNTDLFIPHSGGGRSEVIPAFAPYLPFLYAMRCDIVSWYAFTKANHWNRLYIFCIVCHFL